jgi:hypothetical protein
MARNGLNCGENSSITSSGNVGGVNNARGATQQVTGDVSCGITAAEP